jgi:hypothetical protein
VASFEFRAGTPQPAKQGAWLQLLFRLNLDKPKVRQSWNNKGDFCQNGEKLGAGYLTLGIGLH